VKKQKLWEPRRPSAHAPAPAGHSVPPGAPVGSVPRAGFPQSTPVAVGGVSRLSFPPSTPVAAGADSRLSLPSAMTPPAPCRQDPRCSAPATPPVRVRVAAQPKGALIAKLDGQISAEDAKKQKAATMYAWLSEGRVRDAQGRRPGEPGHDARTVLVPDDFLKRVSGTARLQYWSIKAQYNDVVLFFKVSDLANRLPARRHQRGHGLSSPPPTPPPGKSGAGREVLRAV